MGKQANINSAGEGNILGNIKANQIKLIVAVMEISSVNLIHLLDLNFWPSGRNSNSRS